MNTESNVELIKNSPEPIIKIQKVQSLEQPRSLQSPVHKKQIFNIIKNRENDVDIMNEHAQILEMQKVQNFAQPRSKKRKVKNKNIKLKISKNKRDLNYSGQIGNIPGVSEEPNFVYDQILFNKSRINKAKILSHKIGVLKLPISKISTKEALSNSDRQKKCFSDRVQGSMNIKKDNNNDDNDGISCCFFGKK